jgi:ribosomal protein L11 methyltransferase
MSSWKLTAHAQKPVIQAALLVHEELEDWDPNLVISGCEITPNKPQDWVFEAWYPTKPGTDEKRAIAALFTGKAPKITIEKLPDEDWITLSQQGVDPIHAGRFYIRTPEFDRSRDPNAIDLVIPASQAFGTGQHETTAGCLQMLDAMKRRGVVARNIADIGTGTGLLAFGALKLWPRALATASDIDHICVDVVAENAELNNARLGSGAGELTMVVADGMEDPLLQARGPYDLLIANILAVPLIDLAPDFAKSVPAGGNILLAGLLSRQDPKVRRAYRLAGFRLAARLVSGDWSILWMRRRP